MGRNGTAPAAEEPVLHRVQESFSRDCAAGEGRGAEVDVHDV